MDFCKVVMHIVQPGDTFYRLAQRYQTTVPDIIMHNPGVNPYNLQVGTRLRICSGQLEGSSQKDELELNNDMRKAWSDHGFWTAMYMLSRFYGLPGAGAVEERLLQTPGEIASVFGKFYLPAMVDQLKGLLTEHVELTGELMNRLHNNDKEAAGQTEEKWRQNADNIARMLSSANPKYNYDELQRMMNLHLDLLKRQMMAEIDEDYNGFVQATDENGKHLLELADALTAGLMKEFYQTR